LPEVRDVTRDIFTGLFGKYPNSFRAEDMASTDTPRDTYAEKFAERTHFVSTDDIRHQFAPTDAEWKKIMSGEIVARKNTIDLEGLRRNESDVLSERPTYAPLPWRLESYGSYNFLFLLDFGSYRDLQRHRNGVCQVPLIDGQFGMNPWYMQQYAEHLSTTDNQQLLQDIDTQFAAIAALPHAGVTTTPELNQYFYPMGVQALVHVSYSVPQTTYVGELRSGKTVHASLRPLAQKMLNILREDLPGMALYGDFDEDSWSAKRGEQTISSKVA
jgi:hypothetical protein